MKEPEPQGGPGAYAGGYRCYLLDAENRILRRIDLTATTDEAALAEAQGFLDSSASPAAEIWCLGRVVGRVVRDGH